MVGYHVTTPKKLLRYRRTGCILPPVRFWRWQSSAVLWGARVGRTVLLKINAGTAYPLPDHKPRGHACWTPEHVREWKLVEAVLPEKVSCGCKRIVPGRLYRVNP